MAKSIMNVPFKPNTVRYREFSILFSFLSMTIPFVVVLVLTSCSRHVVFTSSATNLVSNDTNQYTDIFIADASTGETQKRIRALDGVDPNGNSSEPAISADERIVVFTSEASNFVVKDTNGVSDIFIADGETGIVKNRIMASDGKEPNGESSKPSLSADGKYLAFQSTASNLVSGDTNGNKDIFIADATTGKVLKRIVQYDGTEPGCASGDPSLSGDGKLVAFESTCSNFISPTEGENSNQGCIFIADVATGRAVTKILGIDGAFPDSFCRSPSLDGTGRFVVFNSLADNLVTDAPTPGGISDVYIADTKSGKVVDFFAAQKGDGVHQYAANPSISSDGRYVAFESYPGSGGIPFFVGDRDTGAIAQIKKGSADFFNEEGNVLVSEGSVYNCDDPSICKNCKNGRYVTFTCNSFNEEQQSMIQTVFIAKDLELATKVTTYTGHQSNSDSFEPAIK